VPGTPSRWRKGRDGAGKPPGAGCLPALGLGDGRADVQALPGQALAQLQDQLDSPVIYGGRGCRKGQSATSASSESDREPLLGWSGENHGVSVRALYPVAVLWTAIVGGVGELQLRFGMVVTIRASAAGSGVGNSACRRSRDAEAAADQQSEPETQEHLSGRLAWTAMATGVPACRRRMPKAAGDRGTTRQAPGSRALRCGDSYR
jgi:hypothetical protein